jgi:hypothetical protein
VVVGRGEGGLESAKREIYRSDKGRAGQGPMKNNEKFSQRAGHEAIKPIIQGLSA